MTAPKTFTQETISAFVDDYVKRDTVTQATKDNVTRNAPRFLKCTDFGNVKQTVDELLKANKEEKIQFKSDTTGTDTICKYASIIASHYGDTELVAKYNKFRRDNSATREDAEQVVPTSDQAKDVLQTLYTEAHENFDKHQAKPENDKQFHAKYGKLLTYLGVKVQVETGLRADASTMTFGQSGEYPIFMSRDNGTMHVRTISKCTSDREVKPFEVTISESTLKIVRKMFEEFPERIYLFHHSTVAPSFSSEFESTTLQTLRKAYQDIVQRSGYTINQYRKMVADRDNKVVQDMITAGNTTEAVVLNAEMAHRVGNSAPIRRKHYVGKGQEEQEQEPQPKRARIEEPCQTCNKRYDEILELKHQNRRLVSLINALQRVNDANQDVIEEISTLWNYGR